MHNTAPHLSGLLQQGVDQVGEGGGVLAPGVRQHLGRQLQLRGHGHHRHQEPRGGGGGRGVGGALELDLHLGLGGGQQHGGGGGLARVVQLDRGAGAAVDTGV